MVGCNQRDNKEVASRPQDDQKYSTDKIIDSHKVVLVVDI